jgi:hypothetical protein
VGVSNRNDAAAAAGEGVTVLNFLLETPCCCCVETLKVDDLRFDRVEIAADCVREDSVGGRFVLDALGFFVAVFRFERLGVGLLLCRLL